jgi:general secretion pathway protein L
VVFLCGGGSELRGIYEHLQSELELDVMPLVPPQQAPWFGKGDKESQRSLGLSSSISIDSATLHRTRMPAFALLRRFHTCAPAVGLALALFQPSPQVNFRKGELAFRTDYAFLRERAPYLAAFTIAVLVCISGWVYASLHVLQQESERLRQRLTTETTALFGEPRTDGDAVLAELKAALREDKSSEKRIPQVSAFDLLEDISRAAPTTAGTTTAPGTAAGSAAATAEANLDVVELHIRAKKVELKATAGSAQYVEDFAAALAKLSCVKNVQKGKVLTVKNTGPDGKSIDVKQFSLELSTTCP